MSIVDDQIRRLDATLDRIQLNGLTVQHPTGEEEAEEEEEQLSSTDATAKNLEQLEHVDNRLRTLVRVLSSTTSSRPLLRRRRLRDAIAGIQECLQRVHTTQSSADVDLRWLVVGKATVQVYGTILNALLDQTIPLSESIWYWDDVLGSYTYTGLYTIQTSPGRFWHSAKEIYADAKARYQSNVSAREAAEQASQTLSDGWKEFYGLVAKSIDDRSLAHARRQILSPFALCRIEARKKQEGVKKLREQGATAIGLLVEEGLAFDEDQEALHNSWKTAVTRSVSLLEQILDHTCSVKDNWTDFEAQVVDSYEQKSTEAEAPELVERLLHILDKHVPQQEEKGQIMAREHGIPSRLVRYWIPAVAFLLSGGTLFRIFTNRREEIITWFRDLGATTVDFWYNWVVEPTKRLIGTIRHDENSELAIMSKDSLRSDRESLERMVVDFAVQNPANGTAYTEAQIAALRSRVREGDLSAVLKAYEKEIQSPAKGAIFGNLVRALLIQVQKTKVDVEVAMNGIDSILKSQELLFGIVGITPGIAISWLAFRWLGSTFGSKRGLKQMQQQGDVVRLLRNIDRTLSNAVPNENNELSYKDNGLLLCEVHVLRQRAAVLIPGNIVRDFLEDLNDLMNIRRGVEGQMKVLKRIRSAYGKWLI